MMGTDFIDDDLSRKAAEAGDAETSASRLSRQKEQLTNQVADTAEEIERLRMRQDELEHEKTSLEELNRKQDEYARSKKDIIENLSRNIILMEKDEVLANRMVELLSASRARFKDVLSEIRDIREESWSEAEFEEELDKALALIESARMEYSKAVAKIDAESWQKGGGQAPLATLEDAGRGALANKGFLFWFKVGVAVSLPVMLVLLLLFLGYILSGVFGWA
jgi:chromosome segregation ATPase